MNYFYKFINCSQTYFASYIFKNDLRDTGMKLNINQKGNGACPLCRKNTNCIVQINLANSIEDLNDPQEHGLEIAIYICPGFEELNT